MHLGRTGRHVLVPLLENRAYHVKLTLQKQQALINRHARGFACLAQLYGSLGIEVARDLVQCVIDKYAERDKRAEDKKKKDASRNFAAKKNTSINEGSQKVHRSLAS